MLIVQIKKETTPLMEAVKLFNLQIVDALLKAGADTNLTDEDDKSALTFALEGDRMRLPMVQQLPIVQQLIKKGITIRLLDFSYATALPSVNGPILQELLKASGIDVNIPHGDDGVTYLMNAAKLGYLDKVKILLEAGAAVDMVDEEGNNALEYAQQSNSPNKQEIIKLLKEYGAKE